MKALLSLLALLLLTTIPRSQAQDRSTQPYGEHTFRQLVSIQLERSLDSPLVMVRSQTLKNALVFSTLYRDKAELDGAIPKIADIAKHDENLQNRRLALAALRSIGSTKAGRHLSGLDEMNEDEYRTLVAGVISEYFEMRSGGSF